MPAQRKAKVTKAEFNKAVNTAVGLLDLPTTKDTSMTHSVPRSARPRIELERFLAHSNYADYQAANKMVDQKVVMINLFDWKLKPDTPSRVTKATLKDVAKALTESYAKTVEMLAFASVFAHRLSPDRLIHLIASAPSAESSYAPERYTLRFSRDVYTLLGNYAEERLARLVEDMWQVGHDGRYWDCTAGIAPEVMARRRRETNIVIEERAAVTAYIEQLLHGTADDPDAANAAVAKALVSQTLPYNTETAQLVANLPYSVELEDTLSELGEMSRVGDPVNPDTLVLSSLIPWLAPADRPESPLSWLVSAALDRYIDPETEQFDADVLPKKPKKWADMYPEEAVADKFPLPNAVYRLHGTALPGVGTATIELVRNAAELEVNRTFMGNCTYLYRNEMEHGTYALFRIVTPGDVYNAAMTLDGQGRWRLREINSRFNRGGVPPDVKAGFDALIAAAPPVDMHR